MPVEIALDQTAYDVATIIIANKRKNQNINVDNLTDMFGNRLSFHIESLASEKDIL